MSTTLKKILSILSYSLMAISIFILVKTELRKYFVFDGESPSANMFLFWISFGLTILFGFCGSKLWPKENKK